MAHPEEHCPAFCVMHDNGAHVGEFDGPGELEGGWHVYSRRREEPDGTDNIEIAIVQDGGPITRHILPLEAVPYQP